MNQRIKELLNQCKVERHNGPPWFEYNQEKFAELLIRECIEINKQELSFNAFETLLNRYKQHFGVEE